VQFEEYPSLSTYKKLAGVAKELGQWEAQRECALSLIDTSRIPSYIGDKAGWRPAGPDTSLRVAIALWENDVEAAWQHANRGACNRPLLIELAQRLEDERLDDALELYRRIVTELLDLTSNAAYEEALGLVKKMGAALYACRREKEMLHYLDQLRAEFKRKRNFIKLLDSFVDARGM
jgi:uncharacterized Zn finger protein